jgi:hypothetical protein
MVPQYQAIVDRGEGPKETIKEMMALGLRTAVSNPEIVAITVHERKFLARHPAFAYVQTAWKQINAIWYGVIQRGIDEGVFRNDLDPRLMLRAINDLAAAAVGSYQPGGRYSVETIIDTRVALIFGGIEHRS